MTPTRMARVLIVFLAALTATGVSFAQGAYVSWDPIYPIPPYDSYEWTMTVVQLPIVESYYYWALQNGFVGGSAFYMGLQPFGSCGITNVGNCKIALFSFFGDGVSSTSLSCAPGADGGPGESCRIPYDWVIGRQYKFLAALTANDGTLESWTGSVTDTVTGVKTTIGSWSIPSSNGLIGTQGISFVESYETYKGGCIAQPYAEVAWQFPVGYSMGQAFVGTVRGTSPTTDCSANAIFSSHSNSIYVETGHAQFSSCDLNQDRSTNVADVQLIINQALGLLAPMADLNGDQVINVSDVQIEINAALGLSCTAQ